MEQLRAIVYGKVQMVMYRDFTQQEAKKLKLNGMVRNLPNGTVEVVAEGERNELELLMRQLRCGPYHAKVSDIETKWLPATNQYIDFTIEKTPSVLG